MKNLIKRVTACAVSISLAAGMLCGCEDTSESGAKEMLLTALDSITSSSENTIAAFVNDTSVQSGSKTTVTLEPGVYLDDLAGVDIKEIAMSADVKVKGGVLGTDLNVSYDDSSILTINAVVDETSDTQYIKFADFMDEYVKLTDDEASEFMDLSDLGSLFGTDDTSSSLTLDTDDALNAASEFDVRGIVSDIDSVIEQIGESIPEADSESTRTIKENDVEASFVTKKVTLNENDKDNISTAAREALENADNIKACISDIYDYDQFLSDLFDSQDSDADDEDEEIIFYFYGDKLVGFGEDNSNYMLSADTKNGYITVIKADDSSDKVSLIMTAVPDGKKLDMELNCSLTTSSDGEVSTLLGTDSGYSGTISLKINDFEVVDENTGAFNANAEAEIPITTSDGEDVTLKLTADYTGDDSKQQQNGEVTVSADGEDKSFVRYSATVEQTDASDISVPAESECVSYDDMDSAIDLNSLEDWSLNLTNALGEELVEKLSELFTDTSDDYYYDDYDYDYDYDYGYDYDSEDYYSESYLDDLYENYGIDFFDYYNDSYTEFDMDGFLSDAEKVYPAEDFEALKEEIEEEYEYYLSTTPNIDILYYDYDIDIDSYFSDDYLSFDSDSFWADVKKVYPEDKLDELEDEVTEYVLAMEEYMSYYVDDSVEA
ncbi:MAG: hypothetical protein LUH08_04195 [Ruminococcus sp.]|nr:hypothetical protein [Ruminococcus sp.]